MNPMSYFRDLAVLLLLGSFSCVDHHSLGKTKKIRSFPASVTIITRTDIENMGYATLEEILINTPGFYHIEIIRGPMSVIYGNNAFFGTVNVVTNEPAKSITGMVSVAYGEENTGHLFARTAKAFDHGWLAMNAGGYQHSLSNAFEIKSTLIYSSECQELKFDFLLPVKTGRQDIDSERFEFETILNYTPNKKLSIMGGYRHQHLFDLEENFLFAEINFFGVQESDPVVYNDLFAQLNLDMIQDLRLILGGRWSRINSYRVFVNEDVNHPDQVTSIFEFDTDTSFTPRLALIYEIADHHTLKAVYGGDLTVACWGTYVGAMEPDVLVTLDSPEGVRLGDEVDGYLMVGANLRYQPDGHNWFINLHAFNLLDEEVWYPANEYADFQKGGFGPQRRVLAGIGFYF